MVARLRALTMFLALSVLWACGDEDKPVPVSEVSISDSAGVTLVDVGPLEGIRAPEWQTEMRFNTAREGVELFRVSSGRILPDGRVVIGNSGNAEVLMLDPEGDLRNRIGREGDGPGEFRRIASIHVTGDGFSVYDVGLARWSYFDRRGEFVATQAMHPPNRIVDLEPLATGAAGSVLAVFGSMRFFKSEGMYRDTTPLLHYESLNGQPDTVGLWAAEEWAYSTVAQGQMRTMVGFGRSLAAAGRDSLAVLGDTDALDVSVWTVGGTERLRIRGGGARIPATAQDGERWRRETVAGFGESMPEQMRDIYAEAPVHDSYPAFDGVGVDPNGRIWIGATAELGEEQREWIVFGLDGSPAGRLTLPADGQLLDVTADQALVLRTDDLGVESVALYAIVQDS